MKFHVIASGSKGNTSILYNDEVAILIDCGVSKKRLVEGLKEINKSIKDIDYFLITHDHCDHIKNYKIIDIKKTYSVAGNVKLNKENELKYFSKYNLKNIEVTILLTSHDATSPCGFLFKDNNEELVYLTDTGFIPESTLELIKNKAYYFIESNHDIGMLFNSNRPQLLKERIFGDYGHLSNIQCSNYLSLLIGNKTQEIIFAHISEECNSEEKVLDTFKKILKYEGLSIRKIKYKCAKQWSSISL